MDIVLGSEASYLLATVSRDPAFYGKVGILMGGYAEYEVSLESGRAVLQALQEAGVSAHEVLVRPDNHWLFALMQDFAAGRVDRVFIALHGKIGEDGTVQAALEMAGIPYTGSRVCASVLAMHKLRTKQIWQALDLPSLPYLELKEPLDPQAIVATLGLPLAIKASASGSTLGISKVKEIDALQKAYAHAREFDDTVIAEPWVNGVEYTVPILGDKALPSIRIVPRQEFYDYTAKYLDDNTGFFCPSGLTTEEEQAVRHLAEKAYHSLGCTQFGRVDFIRDETGHFWLMEVNTIPGLTSHSLVPRSVKALGYTFTDLILAVLSMAK